MKRLWLVGGVAVIGLTVVLERIYSHPGHAVFWWHSVPGFEAVYGLLGCLALVAGAKWLGHAWLQRDVDYYREDRSCR